jgi:hypothetical protein
MDAEKFNKMNGAAIGHTRFYLYLMNVLYDPVDIQDASRGAMIRSMSSIPIPKFLISAAHTQASHYDTATGGPVAMSCVGLGAIRMHYITTKYIHILWICSVDN